METLSQTGSHSAIPTPGRVAQSVARLTQEPEIPGSIHGPATYFRFSFRWFKKGSCQLLAKALIHEVLAIRLGCLSMPRKSEVRLNERPTTTAVPSKKKKTHKIGERKDK